jgi:hypothetical protein
VIQLVSGASDCPKVTVLRPENIMMVTNITIGIGNIPVDLSITFSVASIIKLICPLSKIISFLQFQKERVEKGEINARTYWLTSSYILLNLDPQFLIIFLVVICLTNTDIGTGGL